MGAKVEGAVHVRSAAEYVELLKKHAFENVEYAQIPDDTPTPENYQTTSFNTLDDMRAFKRVGALLLMRQSQMCGIRRRGTRFTELLALVEQVDGFEDGIAYDFQTLGT